MLTETFQVKLIDLGSAEPLRMDGPVLINRWSTTPNYAPPEVLCFLRDKFKPSPYHPQPVDVFTYGVALFMLKYFQKPFLTTEKKKYEELCPARVGLYYRVSSTEFFKLYGIDQIEGLDELIW